MFNTATNKQAHLSMSNSSLSSGSQQSKSGMSHLVSWKTIMDAKNANSEFLRESPASVRKYRQHDVHLQGYYPGNEYGMYHPQSGRRLSSMAPALIPDSKYRARLLGRRLEKQKQSGVVDKVLLAKIAGYFAIVGFIFLTFVGILIDTQPMFLQGILDKNQEITSDGKKVRTFYAVSIHDRLEPATRAYRAAMLYLATAIVCFGYAHNVCHYVFKKGWQQYRDIDDVDSTVPTFGGTDDYENDYLPTTAAVHRKAYENRNNGFVVRTWNSAFVTLQRSGIYLASVWQARRRNRRRFAGAKDV